MNAPTSSADVGTARTMSRQRLVIRDIGMFWVGAMMPGDHGGHRTASTIAARPSLPLGIPSVVDWSLNTPYSESPTSPAYWTILKSTPTLGTVPAKDQPDSASRIPLVQARASISIDHHDYAAWRIPTFQNSPPRPCTFYNSSDVRVDHIAMILHSPSSSPYLSTSLVLRYTAGDSYTSPANLEANIPSPHPPNLLTDTIACDSTSYESSGLYGSSEAHDDCILHRCESYRYQDKCSTVHVLNPIEDGPEDQNTTLAAWLEDHCQCQRRSRRVDPGPDPRSAADQEQWFQQICNE